jgi:hypothetical protein
MARNIFTVTLQIIELVPKNDSSSQPLLYALNKHIENLSFVPPEQMYSVLQYNRVRNILMQFLGSNPPTNGWQKDVYDVWMNTK